MGQLQGNDGRFVLTGQINCDSRLFELDRLPTCDPNPGANDLSTTDTSSNELSTTAITIWLSLLTAALVAMLRGPIR